MGKASKWIIRHLLMGRSKEEKDEKQETTSSFLAATLAPAPPTTSKQKRRWSFARSSSADSGGRRSSRGFDSYLVDQIVANALPEFGKEQEREAAVEYYHIPVAAAQEAIKTVIACKPARARGPTQNAAATKIQAAFRCYLARRALLALRGLVKLQAVVRGYLVRKTTTATLRGMHALLSIQVRARFQRIQMADHHHHHLDAQLDCKRRITTTHHDRSDLVHQHHKKEYATERGDASSSKTQADFKSRSRFIDRPPHPQIEIGRREHDLGHFAGRLSISKRAHRLLTCPDHPSSASSGTSSRASNSQFGEHVDAHNLWLPNFMANTESSNAKSRSKSEPKQRPKHTSSPKLRCRRSTSSQQMEIASDFEYRVKKQQQASSSNGHKNQYPWLAAGQVISIIEEKSRPEI